MSSVPVFFILGRPRSGTNMNGQPFEAPNLCLQVSRWKYVARRFLKYQKSYPDRFHLIRYEDLVTQPELSVRKLTEFLGISYESSVFDFYLYKEHIIQTYSLENIQKYHKNLMVPIHAGRVNMWREKLTPEQIKAADGMVLCSAVSTP
ncbi:MAG: sulfotransferase domain-containing protein [bacterium]